MERQEEQHNKMEEETQPAAYLSFSTAGDRPEKREDNGPDKGKDKKQKEGTIPLLQLWMFATRKQLCLVMYGSLHILALFFPIFLLYLLLPLFIPLPVVSTLSSNLLFSILQVATIEGC